METEISRITRKFPCAFHVPTFREFIIRAILCSITPMLSVYRRKSEPPLRLKESILNNILILSIRYLKIYFFRSFNIILNKYVI